MAKPNKKITVRRTLDQREADLTQKLNRIKLQREIATKRDELKKLKTNK